MKENRVPSTCPLCGVPLVQPDGPLDARLLLVGDQPGWKEKMLGRPFVGETGDVLRQELLRVGIEWEACRRTNLWLHDATLSEEEAHLHRGWLLTELHRHKLVLVMGAGVVAYVTGQGVAEVSGLVVRDVLGLPKGTRVLASLNPAMVFKEGSTVGEFKLAVERLAALYHKQGRQR